MNPDKPPEPPKQVDMNAKGIVYATTFLEALQHHSNFMNSLCGGNTAFAIALLESQLRGFKRLDDRMFEQQSKQHEEYVQHLKDGGHIQ